jgi:NAD(P)-dependent dehydrogenase (short-subunit alcohol dehydrogenase family)
MSLVVPMEWAGEPDEIATAIVWLCSPEASDATGALLAGGRQPKPTNQSS